MNTVNMNKYQNTKQKDFENFIIERELDYHQFGIIDKLDVERILNEFIEDSYVKELKYLLIITGKGPLIQPLVPKLLVKNLYVEDFRIAGYFTGQEGAYEVILKD